MSRSFPLTTALRESIHAALLRHRFAEEIEASRAAWAAFADAVYRDIYDATTRRRMEALPKGWLPESEDIRVQFGDASRYDELYFDGRRHSRHEAFMKYRDNAKISRRITSVHRNGCAKTYDFGHTLCAAYEDLRGREKGLQDQIGTAATQASALLRNATTTKKLIDEWPEVAPLVEAVLPTSQRIRTLPAVPIADLNAAFRLPVTQDTGAAA